jgi:hypothetical protein
MVNHPMLQCETMKPRARQEPGILVLHKTLNILETIKEAQAGLKGQTTASSLL